MKINVTSIEPAWSSCAYNLKVWVKDAHTNHEYILETLRKWFGTAEFFWDDCFLCDKKNKCKPEITKYTFNINL